MKDPRYAKLAKLLIEYSVDLQPGEKVLIEVTGGEIPLAKELIHAAYEAGGVPFMQLREPKLMRELFKGATREQMELWASFDYAQMEAMDAYIGLRAANNLNDYNGVQSGMELFQQYYNSSVHGDSRVNRTKWVVLRYPNDSMAQAAGMSTEDFEDFYFQVCTLDYKKMSDAMQPLADLMRKTNNVRITGPGTDLSFSIQGIGAMPCDGRLNVPDGEVYSAPVRDSVNGTLQFNAATLYNGITFENIRLVFQNGKIIEATANNTEALNRILDTDEGARYIGEFSIAFNPYILEPMKDILFDEKIAGSFHFTPGSSYRDETHNGNESAVHWDMVCIQRPEYGGGEIYFDDVLIRKDGRFVIPELEGLNPEHLK